MGPGGFFLTNLDLADILGDTDLDFESFIFWIFLDPKFPEIWLGPSLGPAWASLGPAWAQLGPGLGPAWAWLGPRLGPALARLGPSLGPVGGPSLGLALSSKGSLLQCKEPFLCKHLYTFAWEQSYLMICCRAAWY